MLIVEGPDGAGKTTLIKHLAEAYDLPVAPRVVSKDAEAMVNLAEWVDENLDQGFQGMIFDRHRLISEPVYGPILRSHQDPHFRDVQWLAPRMRRLYALRPVIIYCLPKLETVMHNVQQGDDNRVVQEKIEAIYTAYAARAGIDYGISRLHWSVNEPHSTPTAGGPIVRVWDYERSLRIHDQPIWQYTIGEYIKERLSK